MIFVPTKQILLTIQIKESPTKYNKRHKTILRKFC